MIPRVSIVLITCNRLDLMRNRALPSALEQNYQNFEVIVVDDNSSDDTGEFLADLVQKDERVRFVRHEKNRGASAARNTGVKHSTGEFILFLDDDDELHLDFLRETVPVLSAMSYDIGALAVGRLIIDKGVKVYTVPEKQTDSFYSAIDDGWLLRRSVFDKIAWDEELYHDDDAGFGIDFFRYFQAAKLDKLLFYKYVHKEINGRIYPSFGLPSEKRLKGLDNFVRKYFHIFETKGNKGELAFMARFIGRTYTVGGQLKKGLPFLVGAFRAEPSLRNALNIFMACLGKYVYRFYWRSELWLGRMRNSLKSAAISKEKPL